MVGAHFLGGPFDHWLAGELVDVMSNAGIADAADCIAALYLSVVRCAYTDVQLALARAAI